MGEEICNDDMIDDLSSSSLQNDLVDRHEAIILAQRQQNDSNEGDLQIVSFQNGEEGEEEYDQSGGSQSSPRELVRTNSAMTEESDTSDALSSLIRLQTALDERQDHRDQMTKLRRMHHRVVSQYNTKIQNLSRHIHNDQKVTAQAMQGLETAQQVMDQVERRMVDFQRETTAELKRQKEKLEASYAKRLETQKRNYQETIDQLNVDLSESRRREQRLQQTNRQLSKENSDMDDIMYLRSEMDRIQNVSSDRLFQINLLKRERREKEQQWQDEQDKMEEIATKEVSTLRSKLMAAVQENQSYEERTSLLQKKMKILKEKQNELEQQNASLLGEFENPAFAREVSFQVDDEQKAEERIEEELTALRTELENKHEKDIKKLTNKLRHEGQKRLATLSKTNKNLVEHIVELKKRSRDLQRQIDNDGEQFDPRKFLQQQLHDIQLEIQKLQQLHVQNEGSLMEQDKNSDCRVEEGQIAQQQRQVEVLSEELEGALERGSQPDEVRSRLDELRAEIEASHEIEIAELSQQFRKDSQQRMECLVQSNQQLLENVVALQRESQEHKQREADLLQERERLSNEITSMQQTQENRPDAIPSEKYHSLVEELSACHERLETSEKGNQSLQDRVRNLESQHQVEITELEALVANTEMERADLHKQCQILETENTKRQKESELQLKGLETAQQDNDCLAKEIERLQTKCQFQSGQFEEKAAALSSAMADLEKMRETHTRIEAKHEKAMADLSERYQNESRELMHQMEQSNQQLQAQLDSVQDELQEGPRQHKERESELVDENGRLLRAMDELISTHGTQQDEAKAEFESRYQSLAEAFEAGQDRLKASDETNQSLRDQIIDLKLQTQGRIQELEALVAYTEMERASLFSRCQSLQQEREQLQTEVAAQVKNEGTAGGQENGRLVREIGRLESRSEAAERKVAALLTAVAGLESQLGESRQENVEFQHERDALKMRLEETEHNGIDLNERATQLELQLKTMLKENMHLQGELAQQKLQLSVVDQEKDSLHMRFLELEAKSHGDWAGIQVENAFLKEQTKDANETNLSLQHEIQRMNAETEKEQQRASSEIARLQKQVESLNAEMEDLQTTVSQRDAELEDGWKGNTELEDRNLALVSRCKELETNNVILTQKVSTLLQQADNNRSMVHGHFGKLEEQLEKLRSKLETARQQEMNDLRENLREKYERRIETLREGNEKLLDKVRTMHGQSESLQEEQKQREAALLQEIQTLSENLEEARSSASDQTNMVNKCGRVLRENLGVQEDSLEALLVLFQKERESLQKEVCDLSKIFQERESENKFLQHSVDEMANANESLEQQVLQLKTLVGEAEIETSQLVAQADELESQVEKCQRVLRENLGVQEQNLDSLLVLFEEERRSLQTEIEKLEWECENNSLKKNNDKVIQVNESLQEQISRLKTRVEDVEIENLQLSTQSSELGLQVEKCHRALRENLGVEEQDLDSLLALFGEERKSLQIEVEKPEWKCENNSLKKNNDKVIQANESLQEQISCLKTRVAEVEIENSKLTSALAVQLQDKGAQNDPTTIKENVLLRDKVAALQSQIESLRLNGGEGVPLYVMRGEAYGSAEQSGYMSTLLGRSDTSVRDSQTATTFECPTESVPTVVQSNSDIDYSLMSTADEQEVPEGGTQGEQQHMFREILFQHQSRSPAGTVNSPRSNPLNQVEAGAKVRTSPSMVQTGTSAAHDEVLRDELAIRRRQKEDVAIQEYGGELESHLGPTRDSESDEQNQMLEMLYERCQQLENEHGKVVQESLEWVNSARRAYEAEIEAKVLELRQKYDEKIRYLEGQLLALNGMIGSDCKDD